MNRKRLDRLSKHYKKDPTAPPTLKSGGRKNNTATLTLQDTQQVVQFIRNYAEEHAISLPGRVPGFKRDDILLLPSAHVKSSIYRRYKQSAEQAGRRKVGASTFRKLWATLCPFTVVAKIMTDLCWRCQKNVSRVYQSANLTHAEKQEALTIHQAHLSDVDAERAFYKDLISEAKRVVQQQAIQRLELNAPNSKDLVMHYSFDYAQQVHYPCSPAQPGPISLAEDWDHKDIVNMPQFMQLGQMPPQIPAPGLSHERQTYLQKSIREFVRVDVRDRVCPPPV
ncbi:hypothetical protein ACOMHN_012787 [Nucella lapillus]